MKTGNSSSIGVMILAAGLGKRMRSTLPKVLHEMGGKPLIYHVLSRVKETASQASICLVVGHGREQVESYIRSEPNFEGMDIHFVFQELQKGTGHAARCAMDSEWGTRQVKQNSLVLVLPGDLPLISAQMVSSMVSPLEKSEALKLLTTELSDPTGYGRIVRKGKRGPVQKIVEEKDANAREKQIKEVGASIYSFRAEFLRDALRKLSNKNAQGEYYLTDVIAQAIRVRKKVSVLEWSQAEDLRGVNDPWELSQAIEILNRRIIRHWAVQGVKFLGPNSTHLDVIVTLGEGTVVHPGVILRGDTRIGKSCVLGSYVVLKDVEVSDEANLKTGTTAEQSRIESQAQLGPYAHLRPESVVGNRAKIGNFVELKKTRIGEGTSVAHLSYLGDAEVGRNVNIGCGFVTCNFDGRMIDGQRKHRTVIEDDVFLGSDCQAVAPVKIGKGAYIASGSTITEDVEPGALAIARSRQVNKPGYAAQLKKSKE
jgi:bifunctional UDP-N-acetylglucosamine pyrophosphorylase/glucosamine-1-phosphate N-acetyltransferase